MIWKRQKIKTNEGKTMPCWQDKNKIYCISQNINGGKPKNSEHATDKKGYVWLFEITKQENSKKVVVGLEKTLKLAKQLAEKDAKSDCKNR